MGAHQTLAPTSKAHASSGKSYKSSRKTGSDEVHTGVSVVDKIAARAATDLDFRRVLDLIADLPARPAGQTVAYAAQAVNGARRRAMHDEFMARSLTTEAARQLLGAPRAQNLHTARQRGRLIGQTFGNVTYFPAWQFDGGAIRPDLARILDGLGRYADDAVVADRVMRLPREELDGRSIIDGIDDSRLAPTAWIVLADSSH